MSTRSTRSNCFSFSIPRTILLAAAAALMMAGWAGGLGGCTSSSGSASSASSRGEKIASSYGRTKGHLAASQDQIDQTLNKLSSMRMTDPTNLKNAFAQYKKSVSVLEERGDEARQLAAAMQEDVDVNMMSWQKEMESIKDPAVKTTVQARREAVRSNYDQLKTYAQDARKSYDVFLTDNQDIVKALSINLSGAAVQDLSGKMDRTAADGQALKQKIAAMQRGMDNIAKGQTSSGATAAPAPAMK